MTLRCQEISSSALHIRVTPRTPQPSDESLKWAWRVYRFNGECLAKGARATKEGAEYAATMEARLFDPNFQHVATHG